MDKNIIEVIQEIYCLLCDMRYPVFVHQLTNWEADRIEDDITAKTFHDYCYRMQLVWCTADHFIDKLVDVPLYFDPIYFSFLIT